MKRLPIILILFSSAFALASAAASEQTILARITVYWPSGNEPQVASYNGLRLHGGHCAVDPKRIPYGSKIVFPDTTCLAIDSGPAVVSRLAARKCGKTADQRNALVIDRYFETKKAALSWAAANPHFMKVRVLDPHQKLPELPVAANLQPGLDLPSKPSPKTYSQNADPAPDGIRGSLIPMVFGPSLPRS